MDQDGKSLAGAEFTLTDNNGTATKAVTGKDGLATFTIAEGATYSLEETKTPAGYTGSFKQAGITLANDGQVFSYTANVRRLRNEPGRFVRNVPGIKVDQMANL
ncbi:hypothetical protein LCAUW1_2015 [Lacticaseibacillus paracasei]|nr:hypothetical protein LCAUW1_2015 [Lacticaseibacillus paracasei]